MAVRRVHMGERIIEADNGFGWSFQRGYWPLTVHCGVWKLELFGLTYHLAKYGGSEPGWYLYLGRDVNRHFYGEPCGLKVMAAIDKATELITKADLRGEGYEKRG